MIINGDALDVLRTLPTASVQTCVTSPPYYQLRDYGMVGQIGLEATLEEYIEKITAVFREVRRMLCDDGTCWVNLGDTYAVSGRGGKSEKQDTNKGSLTVGALRVGGHKQLLGVPWRIAFALQADGWILRQDIIWHKTNPMPESVTDRCTKAHEYIFLLTKSTRYYYDADAIREPYTSEIRESGLARARRLGYNGVGSYQDWYNKERKQAVVPYQTDGGSGLVKSERFNAYVPLQLPHPIGRNKRSVWTIASKPVNIGNPDVPHFATFPPDLIRPCIMAGAPVGHTVLDPFFGSGTTGMVAKRLHRRYIGIELNPDYIELAKQRLGLCTAAAE